MIEQEFDPSQDPKEFRNTLGLFPTGVTVITTHNAGEPVGITVNSFASVSLDPPLVLWCPAKGSRRYEIFCKATHYAIHVLGEDQPDVSSAFVKREGAFDGVETRLNEFGVPLLQNTLTRFECATDAIYDAGDHSIIVGRVLRCSRRPGVPLVFAQGNYAALAKPSEGTP